MNFQDLEAYCTANIGAEDAVLARIERETYLEVLNPHMLSGPYQGRFLTMLTAMKQPATVLEIGTFTAYSTICLARGLGEGATLTTIEINPELENRIDNNLMLAGVQDKVRLIIGDAVEVVPVLDKTFDMVFMDAAKRDYAQLYEMILPKLTKGGIILVDNVLWKGEVLSEPRKGLGRTIDEFNKMIREDSRVEHLIIPLRDGLMICIKN